MATEHKGELVPGKPLGAALVVGGGIAGVQAALDLAGSGIKVYLVERAPTIGGKMAQLDKTFPTNDCAMCILSPKLVEAGRHRNIEIIATTDLVAWRASQAILSPRSAAGRATSTWTNAPPATTASRSAPSTSPANSTRAWPSGPPSTSPTPRPSPALTRSRRRAQPLQGHLPGRHQRPRLHRPHRPGALRRGPGGHQAVQPLPGYRRPRVPSPLRERMQPGQAGQAGVDLRPEAVRGRYRV